MEWLSENWVFLLIAVAFVAMHLFGHGGHGGHGRSEDQDRDARKDREQDAPRGGHRH
ncbi:MAG TPA: DUF2933 domain-containing protein [Burkholderiales bacterium]